MLEFVKTLPEEVLDKLATEVKRSCIFSIREGVKKNRFFLGKSPKLWVGGGQES